MLDVSFYLVEQMLVLFHDGVIPNLSCRSTDSEDHQFVCTSMMHKYTSVMTTMSGLYLQPS